MTKRTCFVVSRIGEEGSEIRNQADDVFDLLVQPALEKYGIEAVRADHIAGTGSITSDVIRLVQESDLCIIDLSGKNPNVYYECGRRHETGKPFIQIISREEEMPFDIADIRTVKYELTDPREVRNAALKIQSFVEEIIEKGFTATSGATSMASLFEALNRIERRLVSLEGSTSSHQKAGDPGAGQGFRSLIDNPQRTFQEAFIRGDIATIISLLPRLEGVLQPGNFVMAAGILAIQGNQDGYAALQRTLNNHLDVLDGDEARSAITSMVQYHIARGSERAGVEDIRPFVERLLNRNTLTSEQRGYLYNQLGMISHGAEQFESALSATEDAIRSCDTEPSYHYNISIIYEKLGLLSKAVESARRSLELGTEKDSDHVSHAYELFVKAGHFEEATKALASLEEVNPAKAAFLRAAKGRKRP